MLIRPLLMMATVSIVMTAAASIGVAQPEADSQPASDAPAERWAVIFVGLPGDAAHEEVFAETAAEWQKWLTETLDFPADHVVRLPAAARDDAAEKDEAATLTAESMRTTLTGLSAKLREQDAIWIFTLGHGSHDGKRAWFHVSGRDPSDEDFSRWISGFRCREQVLWLTHSSSGWFTKPASRAGRIVITATAAEEESNETEFPHALATIGRKPLSKLDADEDGSVSVAELFTTTVAEVNRQYKNDERLPTEHAILDDNGDGTGTEDLHPKTAPGDTPPLESKIDGALAKRTFVKYRPQK